MHGLIRILTSSVLLVLILYQVLHSDMWTSDNESSQRTKSSSVQSHNDSGAYKVILRWTKFYGGSWGVPEGRSVFGELDCPEQRCVITDDRDRLVEASAVLVHIRDVTTPDDLPRTRTAEQRWVFFNLESPYNTRVNLSLFNGLFNWTSTYSSESDLPAPYGSYKISHQPSRTPVHNHSAIQRPRLAAWFVTNCHTVNGRELAIRLLQRHLPVDIYGICGDYRCGSKDNCFDMLQHHYSYYMAMENSNCREYITEKFWHNSLQQGVVPVVMGAPKSDYLKMAPPNSFIHMSDFKNPKQLARHLRRTAAQPSTYNRHLAWRSDGSVQSEVMLQPTQSRLWCSLCHALHDSKRGHSVHWDLDTWWSPKTQCSNWANGCTHNVD